MLPLRLDLGQGELGGGFPGGRLAQSLLFSDADEPPVLAVTAKRWPQHSRQSPNRHWADEAVLSARHPSCIPLTSGVDPRCAWRMGLTTDEAGAPL